MSAPEDSAAMACDPVLTAAVERITRFEHHGCRPFVLLSHDAENRELMESAVAIVQLVARDLREDDCLRERIYGMALEGALSLIALDAMGAAAYEAKKADRPQ